MWVPKERSPSSGKIGHSSSPLCTCGGGTVFSCFWRFWLPYSPLTFSLSLSLYFLLNISVSSHAYIYFPPLVVASRQMKTLACVLPVEVLRWFHDDDDSIPTGCRVWLVGRYLPNQCRIIFGGETRWDLLIKVMTQFRDDRYPASRRILGTDLPGEVLMYSSTVG